MYLCSTMRFPDTPRSTLQISKAAFKPSQPASVSPLPKAFPLAYNRLMRIIVDGYNFIGRDKGLRGDLEKKRRLLIEQLSSYRRIKGFPVTVVFDGGDFGETREQIGGIEVIFSGRGVTADEVICRMAEELREGCTVASSDREVQRRVLSSGGIAIYSGEFEKRLQAAIHPGAATSEKEQMEKAALDEMEGPSRTVEKKGNPRKLSKAERLRQGRLKRL